MSDVVLNMIVALCMYDTNVYKIQDHEATCVEYYGNCIVDKGLNKGVESLNRCQDELHKQKSN